MFIETKIPYSWKNRTILNIADRLSAKPAKNSNNSLKGMQKCSFRSSGHSQIRSESASNLCCDVCALNIISIWELKRDSLDHVNYVHPLINLREDFFNQLHYH